MDTLRAKNLSNTYLYSKFTDYNKNLFNFIMKSHLLDKANDSFNEIRYEVKKYQVNNALVKVLTSNNVMLMIYDDNPLPAAFKVFVAKDIKGDGKKKVFIDCTGIIHYNDGVYTCSNPSILISYLVAAMNALVYEVDPKRVIMNNNISLYGSRCFSSLFTYVLDYIYKINSIGNTRDKCLFLTSMYFQVNILGKDEDSDSVLGIAKKISGLSERETDIIRIQLEENSFDNIKYFVETCSRILKIDKLTLNLLIEKWMFIYGPGTLFGLELYPEFSSMITDAYVGAYLNNQKTIEKVANKDMVQFAKTILQVGADAI